MWYSPRHSSKFKAIRTTILILILFAGQPVLAQKQKTKEQYNNFYFYYGMAGLGSNLGSLQPTLRIYGNRFTYTKEQNSHWVKRSKKIEFISKGFIRQSSIDSILLLVQKLKESKIYRINPCIMSGGITYIKIAIGGDTTKFTLQNTSDTTALKIINIINPYLPKKNKLKGSEKDIQKEEDCRTFLREKMDSLKKDNVNSYLSQEAVWKIYEKKYDSLRAEIKDSLSMGINNVNDYCHVFTSSQKQLLDSLIKDFKQTTNIQITVFTFDSSMTSQDSVEQVTQIIGTTHRINTTIGISFPYRFMHIWNDSLINNTVLYQYQTKQIIDKDFVPFFKKGDFFNGTYEGIKAIIRKMNMNRFYNEQIKNGN